jgi:hypothetical protein
VNRWLEPLLAIAVAATVGLAIIHLFRYGYLPEPFFYEPSDTWMDWFNTAYWAHNPGAYDSWGTIYPPLSFAILRFLTNGSCYAFTDGLETRDCDLYGVITLHAIFLMNCVLIWKTFRKIDSTTAWPRTVALSIGFPMAFTLERGNILLLTFTFVLLAFGPLVKSARLRWVFAGLAINLKVYLIGSIFAQLLRRRWRWFEGALFATILIYLVSFAAVGAGTPREIYDNISDYASGFQAASVLDLWYAGTYRPLLSLLQGGSFPVVQLVGSWPVEFLSVAVPIMTHAVQATILLAAIAACLCPKSIPPYRLVFLAIAMAVITSEAGGYTQIFLILFVFMERWSGFGAKWAIVTAYVLCLAADIPIARMPPLVHDSFLTGGPIFAEYDVTLGPFLRPLLIMSLAFALSLTTLSTAWSEIRFFSLSDLVRWVRSPRFAVQSNR